MHMRKSQKFGFEKGRVPHKPLRTAVEMADEFGVTHRSLVSQMNVDPDGPRPEIKNRTGTAIASWYKPDVVRAWWAKRQAVPQEATGAAA